MNTPDTKALTDLTRPMLEQLGVDLVDLQWKGRGRDSILRLIIDKPGGVDLDECERVSTAVSALLDAYDPIQGTYSLEVSSPGAERPLVDQKDWESAVGRRVNVRYKSGERSEMIVEGKLLALESDKAEIQIKDRNKTSRIAVDLHAVIAARVTVDI